MRQPETQPPIPLPTATYHQTTKWLVLLSAPVVLLLYLIGARFLPTNLALLATFALPVVALGLVLLRHIRLAIALVVLYAPIELFVQKWLPGNVGLASRYFSEALLVGLLLALLLDRLVMGKPWKRTPLDWPILLFVGIGLVSALVNGLPTAVLIMGLRITLRYVLLYYLIVQIGFNQQQTRRLLIAMLVMAGLVMLIGLIQAIVGPPMNQLLRIPDLVFTDTATRALSGFVTGHGRYIFSTLGRYDALGIYAIYILLIIFAYLLHHRHPHPAWAGLAFISAIALLLTLSRQAWLAFYVALGVWALVGRRKWSLLIFFFLFVVPLIILLLALLFPDLIRYYSGDEANHNNFITRILSGLSSDYWLVTSSTGGRVFVLRYVSQRIMELVPLWGFGPGRFGTITASYFGYDNATLLGMTPQEVYLVFDVNWVTLLGQYGILGVFAFLFIFWRGWRVALWLYRHATDSFSRTVALATLGIIPAFLLLGFFGPNFEQRIVAMYAWLMMALVVSLTRYQYPHPPPPISGTTTVEPPSPLV
jgi:hypothetical protein